MADQQVDLLRQILTELQASRAESTAHREAWQAEVTKQTDFRLRYTRFLRNVLAILLLAVTAIAAIFAVSSSRCPRLTRQAISSGPTLSE